MLKMGYERSERSADCPVFSCIADCQSAEFRARPIDYHTAGLASCVTLSIYLYLRELVEIEKIGAERIPIGDHARAGLGEKVKARKLS